MKKPQHNIESQVFDSLKNREIKPSAQAWDRIDAMLTQTEVQKPKSQKKWLPFAASFLLLGFLSLFFFNNEQEKQSIDVVNTTIQKETEEANQAPTKLISNATQIVENKIEPLSKSNKQELKSTVDLKAEQVVPHDSLANQKLIVEQKNESTKKITVDAQKLLAEVENELYSKPTKHEQLANNSTQIKIDPTLLLDEAEHEMNQSFKEKTIEKVHQKFKNLKEALVKNEE